MHQCYVTFELVASGCTDTGNSAERVREHRLWCFIALRIEHWGRRGNNSKHPEFKNEEWDLLKRTSVLSQSIRGLDTVCVYVLSTISTILSRTSLFNNLMIYESNPYNYSYCPQWKRFFLKIFIFSGSCCRRHVTLIKHPPVDARWKNPIVDITNR